MIERKAYRIQRAGSFKNLKLVTEKLAAPLPNEVTVEIKSIGLNFADIFSIWGLYSATPKGSFIPGLEYSGIIVDKGSEVKNFNTGDRVMGITRFGAYTTHLNIDENYVFKLPLGWTFEEGASFIVSSLTAYYGLVALANIKKNQTILINSAAGGVGIYANRIAKKFNAYTIGTVGSNNKKEILSSEGFDKIMVRDKNFRQQVIEALDNRPLEIVMESIGGKIFWDCFNLLAPTGRIIVYGSAHFSSESSNRNLIKILFKYFKRPKIDPLKLIDSNKSVMGFNLIWLWEKHQLLKYYLIEIFKLELAKPFIGKIFKFDEMQIALKEFRSGRTFGKVVINI